MRWLDLAPNLREFNLKYCAHYSSDNSIPPPYEVVIPQIHLTHLRIINQLSGLFPPTTKFILDHTSCPALKVLRLKLGWETNNSDIRAVCEFLRRSEPSALESAVLDVSASPVDSDLIIEALTHIPSLRKFAIKLSKDNSSWNSIVVLLNALTKTRNSSNPTAGFALLPALENLEINYSRIPSLAFIELIEARRRVHGKSLKCLKLSDCSGRVDSTWDEETIRSDHDIWAGALFSDVTSDKDLDRLPEEWKNLKVPIEGGLRFVIEKDRM